LRVTRIGLAAGIQQPGVAGPQDRILMDLKRESARVRFTPEKQKKTAPST